MLATLRSARRLYTAVLARPTAARDLAGVFLGTLPNAVLPLGLLLVMTERGASAGLATAAFVLGSLTAPLRGRMVDRRGHVSAMWTIGGVRVLALVPLAAGGTSLALGLMLLCAMAVGVAYPPFTGVFRARLSALDLNDGDDQAASALVSLLQDVVFVVGPLLATGVFALSPDRGIFVVSAAATVAGLALLVGVSHAEGARRPVRSDTAHRATALRLPAVRRLTLTFMPVGIAIDAIAVAAVTYADARHAPHLAGVLLAVFAVGSAIGGIAYGASPPAARPYARTALLAAALAVLVVAAVALETIGLIIVGFGLLGAPLAALFTAAFVTARGVPATVQVETVGWLGAANALGAGIGASFGAFLAHSFGWHAVMALSAGAMLGTAATAWRFSRTDPGAPGQPGGRPAPDSAVA